MSRSWPLKPRGTLDWGPKGCLVPVFGGFLGGGALKQLLFILMPKSAMASSHSEMMRIVLSKSQGGIAVGKDVFDAFDEMGSFEKNQAS